MPLRFFEQLKRRVRVQAWRRRARKKHTARLRLTDVPGFLERLEQQGIPSVVLRWPEEVPRTPFEETGFTGDVDMLIDGRGLKQAIEIAAGQPGPVKCDLYTSTGHRGTTYRKMPYYPPVLAERILADRQPHEAGVPVPGARTQFPSLAFHLVYHKGLQSGIASGCHLESCPHPTRDYPALLAQLASRFGVECEQPITLASMHRWLKTQGWDMPVDLLARWPKQTAWHEWLWEQEVASLRTWAERLPQLLVFLVRDDAVRLGLAKDIYEMLREKFSVLVIETLTETQSATVMARVRGGNWIEHGKTTLVPPRVAVVCYDHQPLAVDSAKVTSRERSSYPLVENANVFHKHEIRERLNRGRRSGEPRIHGLHGSDTACEAQHMLEAVFGPRSDSMNADFLAQVNGHAIDLPGQRRAG